MAKISSIIQPSNFELIRDRIGIIIFNEINNQLNLTNNTDLQCEVYIERNTPVDKVEIPVIIISYASANYDNKDQVSVRGRNEYFIDVYTSATSNANIDGEVRSAVSLHRLLGICRYILEHTAYKTLDFQNPLISHTSVNSINIRNSQSNDAMNTAMGRIIFSVTANEDNGLQCACNLSDYYTNVKIDTTDEGYVYLTAPTE